MEWDRIIDIFNFKNPGKDYLGNEQPDYTMGSIVWGILFRSFVVIIISFSFIRYYEAFEYWYFALFLLWFITAMPAYNAFKNLDKETEDFVESTLCGSCRHFAKGANLCKIYDQHPTKDLIPCEGDSWEPFTFEDNY